VHNYGLHSTLHNLRCCRLASFGHARKCFFGYLFFIHDVFVIFIATLARVSGNSSLASQFFRLGVMESVAGKIY
jgi:hypothetical protein